jgi:dCMP deaminase
MRRGNEVSEKWDRRFLDLAKFVAGWSKDPSTKVGAVIVRPDRTVAAIGYNGFPRGVLDHEARYADRDQKYPMVVHAETNAIINSRESLEGCTLYVTALPPCAQCAGVIIQRGITRVVIDQKKELPENWKKQFEISSTMFQEAGVAVAVVPEVKQKLANDNTTEAATTAKATSPKIAG